MALGCSLVRCHAPTWAEGGGKAREGQGPKRTRSPKLRVVVVVGSKPRILLLFSLWFFMFLLKDRHQPRLLPGQFWSLALGSEVFSLSYPEHSPAISQGSALCLPRKPRSPEASPPQEPLSPLPLGSLVLSFLFIAQSTFFLRPPPHPPRESADWPPFEN